MSGRLIAVLGVDRKSGTTTIAKSLAQWISKAKKDPVLFISNEGNDRVITANEISGVILGEMGCSYMEGFQWEESIVKAKEQFKWIVTDVGCCPVGEKETYILDESEHVVFVSDQSESDFRNLMGAWEAFSRDFKTTKDSWVIALNHYRTNDPHDCHYVQKMLAIDTIVPVYESDTAREAAWEGFTPLEADDRGFRRSIRKLFSSFGGGE